MDQQIDDHHYHQKPPPPYEEIEDQKDDNLSSLPTVTTIGKHSIPPLPAVPPNNFEKIKLKSSAVEECTTGICNNNKSNRDQQHNLSIENPMAEVFANPEFDHIELKIQGHINPNTVPSLTIDDNGSVLMDNTLKMASSLNRKQSSANISHNSSYSNNINAAVMLGRKKADQVFVQWKRNWNRPEVIAIRLVFFALAILLMFQLTRVMMIVNDGFSNKNKSLELISSNRKPEFKPHLGRTGKALANLGDSFNDFSNADPLSSSPSETIQMTKAKLGQSDQDIDAELNHFEHLETQNVEPSDNHHSTFNSVKPLLENESSLIGQSTSHQQTENSVESDLYHQTLDGEYQETKNFATIEDSTKIELPSSSILPSVVSVSQTNPSTTISTTKSIAMNIGDKSSSLPLGITLSTSTIMPWNRLSTSTVSPLLSKLSSQNNANTNVIDKTYNISIIIHSANVPDMDSGYLMGRASDTYCNVFIDDILVGKTPIIDNSNNPSWHYLLPRQFSVKKETWIRIELMDSDHVRNDHIGGILLNFGDLLNNGSLNKPINMFHGRGYIWVTISSATQI